MPNALATISVALTVLVAVPLSAMPEKSKGALSVPVPLRGRWAARTGAIIESCTPKQPDDFKWSISADSSEFHYWEANGIPIKVRQTAANRFIIKLAMTGEGETWTEQHTFTLHNHGHDLVIDYPIKELGLSETHYQRCPKP